MKVNCDDPMDLLRASGHIRSPHVGRLLFAIGLIGLLSVFRAHFAVYIAKGESMQPGLRTGDLVLVERLAYKTKLPQRGDIVVAREGNDLIVKRVVGLPGEEVELRQGILLVNQRPLTENYAVEPGRLSLRRGRLAEGKCALLGDNRSVSSSEFVHAVVSKDQILGKVIHSVRFQPHWWVPGSVKPDEMAEPTSVAHLAIGKELR